MKINFKIILHVLLWSELAPKINKVDKPKNGKNISSYGLSLTPWSIKITEEKRWKDMLYSPETHMDILYRWAKRGRGVSYMGPNHVQINWNHTKVNRKHKPSISKPVLWLANGWCDGSDHPIRSLVTNWLNFVLTILFHITVITESTFLFYVYINYYKSVYLLIVKTTS